MRAMLAGLVMGFAVVVAGGVAAATMGTAVGVDQEAVAKTAGAPRTLIVGSDVAVGETVVTGRSGQVQIIFADRTKLVVGPGSSLRIEEYLLAGADTAEKIAINALSGTFRFITGKSPKGAYEITTPTGTIGVRGTAFDFTVASLETSLVLYHGGLLICNNAGKCAELDDVCAFGNLDAADALVLDNTKAARDAFRAKFPYAASQRSLMGPFRVDGARACVSPAASQGVPESLSDPGECTPNISRQKTCP